MIERFNRILVDSLSKVSEDVTDWDKHIPSVLFAYRTAKQATTKIELFYLVYGRATQFPKKEGLELDENNLLTRLFTLVDNLPKVQGQTQLLIAKQQQKQKEEYQIGNKVLMYEAAKQTSHTGKLEPKWKGPYYIHYTCLQGQTQLLIAKQQQKQKEEYQIGNKVLMYEAAKQTSHTGKLEPKWKGPYYIHYTCQLIQLSVTPRDKWKEFVREYNIPNENYYYLSAIRTYKLFEKDSKQLYYTLILTFKILSQMKISDYHELLQHSQELDDLTHNINLS
ncbi:hypothetical protein Glove_272g11 [Diversispora epigaea]|uniref:Integrase catalytic domain-containing protein n=1 Tax=Diversispora epigaea TaxID=1348612 RepID=A0A397I5A3_9GLOM|nr:hypothetical protein Glove_272g11 [Diversispora epigaea]